MPKRNPHQPRPVPQVMVSSTFDDLKEVRGALIEAIHQHKLHANVMENDLAKLADLIDSSLQMVRDSAAYIGVIGMKYGQTPECPTRNAGKLSITELEFNEAQRLGRPILLFIMGEDHPVKKADFEKDPDIEKKLNSFRERAKRASPDSSVNRVYAVFYSLQEFKSKLGSSLAELGRHLDSADGEGSEEESPSPEATTVPEPPDFYAEPDYVGSHKFVGRDAELQALNDWSKPADPTNLLLFDAIGGNGKSMLTWEWTTKHAMNARTDWAGRFWYSFYEEGAIMADFCQRALAYMTRKPAEDFAKKKTPELAKELLAQLHARPWLLILDGLERVLVAYHRIDAAAVLDEEANAPTDKIVNRNPCDTIRDEDNDLLRALAAAKPSKILVSSRLTPRVLLNPSGQPITGARRITLPGLRPLDAEQLLRSCGIEGDSVAIQSYLTANCDNHPLVIGVLGGLISHYRENRGNFDAWVADPNAGAALDLGSLDLIQRRNHILRAGIDALPPEGRQLLSTLALLTDSVDYETLKALNPHLPPEPKAVKQPEAPEKDRRWDELSVEQKAERQKQYEAVLVRWHEYEQAVQARLASVEFRAAPKELEATVTDLEQRGLLQWDSRERMYNLHPVVRGVASREMLWADRERHGQRVVDHFSSLAHSPYDQAVTLEDLRPGLNVVRTLLKLGHLQKAATTYHGGLSKALRVNLEAYAEILSLVRPMFSNGWAILPDCLKEEQAADLASTTALCLYFISANDEALGAMGAVLRVDMRQQKWSKVCHDLVGIAVIIADERHFAADERIRLLLLDLAFVVDDKTALMDARVYRFTQLARMGQWDNAEEVRQLLPKTDRDWPSASVGRGYAEYCYAFASFWKGDLTEDRLTVAEQLVIARKGRRDLRFLHGLRGDWRLEQGEWASAASSYQEAVRLARERSITDADSETGLALAKHYLRQLPDPHREAERLAQVREPAHRRLAQLWLSLGEPAQAKPHALIAYKNAWADGEPYVNLYELTKTTELLQQLNVPIPSLPSYEPAKGEPFPWESDVRAAIERLRAEKQANLKTEGSDGPSKRRARLPPGE